MSEIIRASTAVLLSFTVGIGLWDAIQSTHALGAGVALIFVISAILNSWAG
jgi:hypothetical protein